MKRNQLFSFITIMLLLLIAFFSRETVQAQRQDRIAVDSVGQKQLEREHEEAVKQILEQHHISNSGIMMTKIIYGGNRREYTIKIHNRLIQEMTSQQQVQLKNELEKITFPLQGCTFIYKFLDVE